MKTHLMIVLLFSVVSCGNQHADGKAGTHGEALEALVSAEEGEFVKDFSSRRDLSQRALLKRVLQLKKLSPVVIRRLDRKLFINCNGADDRCTVALKE